MKSALFTRRELLCALPCGITVLTAGCAGIPIPGVSDPAALLKEGEALYQAQRYDEAIAKFRAVIALDRTNWRAWLWLCRTYIVRGMWGDAIESGRQAFQFSPQGPEVLQTFLQALFGGGAQALGTGNYTQAISHFSEYLKLDTGNVNAWTGVGKAYLGNGQYGDALQSLLKALGMTGVDRGDVVNSILSGGMQAFNQRDYASSINMLSEYVKQDPRNFQAYFTLAKSYWESGQRGGAAEALVQALKINPTSGDALQYMFKLR